MRESQLDPFSLLFVAKQPATPAVACMLFMAVFWIAVASVYTWLCFRVKFGQWIGPSCCRSSGRAELRLQQQWRGLPALTHCTHSPRLARVWLQWGRMPWQSSCMACALGGGGGRVGCAGTARCPTPPHPTSQMPDVGPGGRSLLVPFCILLCGVEPCQAQKFTLQVKPNQNMCPRRTLSAFLLAGMQSVGQVRAEGGNPKQQVLWTWGPQQCLTLQTSSRCPVLLANTTSKRKLSEGPRAPHGW